MDLPPLVTIFTETSEISIRSFVHPRVGDEIVVDDAHRGVVAKVECRYLKRFPEKDEIRVYLK